MRFTVRVPATLGEPRPGVRLLRPRPRPVQRGRRSTTEAPPGVSWEGEGADELPTDGTDLDEPDDRRDVAGRHAGSTSRRSRCTAATGSRSSAGSAPPPPPPSPASCARVGAARSRLGTRPYAVFALAAEIEGHPDNAAPAVFGGFTIAMPGGVVRASTRTLRSRPVVIVPPLALVDGRGACGASRSRCRAPTRSSTSRTRRSPSRR